MNSFESDIQHCMAVLQAGGVILYPTDTVWGLGCDATNAEAVAKIYQLKNRTDSKALIVLVAGEREILQYTAAVDLSLFEYLEQTQHPTTVIYDHGIGFADNLTAEDGSIAIRICKNEFCKALLKRFGKPIVSTSANISGEPTPTHFHAISKNLVASVDYTVQWNQEDTTPHQASAIIRWTETGIQFIRK